jgi:hypothetical protein
MAVTVAPFELRGRREAALLAAAESAFGSIGDLFEAGVQLSLAPA